MRLFILLLLIFIAVKAFSQKTVQYTIVEIKPVGITHIELTRFVHYDSLNIPIDTNYILIGRNNRYTQLFEYITLKSGAIQDIYDLLNKATKFIDAELAGTSTTYKGNYLSVEQLSGWKYIYIYGNHNSTTLTDKNGYTVLDGHKIKKVMTLIEGYCSRKNIKL